MTPFDTVPSKATKRPTPFEINIKEEKLAEFKTLLKLSKVTSPTYENLQEDRRYGVTSKWLQGAKDRWENHFDWRAVEKRFNSFPNFMMPVVIGEEKFDIHFVSLFSEREDAVPIMLLHGWPGSFLEFLGILSLMKQQYTPQNLPFHFIVPSLIGYAFSSTPPLHRNFNVKDVADVLGQLMLDLGFGDGYVVQGGDIGSKIARIIAVEQKSCKAALINACFMAEPSSISRDLLTDSERKGLMRGQTFAETGSAYALEQATRPSTIGLVLGSNPLALLAWIGEKFLEWSDQDPDIDVILESVMLYWVTETFPRAIYPYRQRNAPGNIGGADNPEYFIKKPLGFSSFPKELTLPPRSWVATTGNLVFYQEHNKGGHFAALEQPQALMGDLVDFIQQVWNK